MTPFAIAGIQMNISAVQDNIPRFRQRLDVVMHLYPWVQMVVWSELAGHGPFIEKAVSIPGPIEEAFQEMAHRHQIWLLPGTFYEKTDAGIFNTLSVIDPNGEVVGRYRKMFPFIPYEQGVTAGNSFLVFDVPEIGRFGTSICYDMWFPETSRTLVAMGAEVILHPVLTTTIDRQIELAIAQATAAVNQCFVFDVNGIGDGGNGRSLVVGPVGDVLYQAGTSEDIFPIEIDLDRVRRSREVGLRGLGQPLKSFRDSKVVFDIYKPGAKSEYLDTLGSLVKASRGTRAGLRKRPTEKTTAAEPDSPPPAAP